jgi:NADH dehydrogenase
MKILVTGGTGFIGTYLCAHLIQFGNEVTILARSDEGLKAQIGRASCRERVLAMV